MDVAVLGPFPLLFLRLSLPSPEDDDSGARPWRSRSNTWFCQKKHIYYKILSFWICAKALCLFNYPCCSLAKFARLFSCFCCNSSNGFFFALHCSFFSRVVVVLTHCVCSLEVVVFSCKYRFLFGRAFFLGVQWAERLLCFTFRNTFLICKN